MLANGVELHEVSKLLSHSEIRVTADLYNHLVKQTATKAAGLMDGLLTSSTYRRIKFVDRAIQSLKPGQKRVEY